MTNEVTVEVNDDIEVNEDDQDAIEIVDLLPLGLGLDDDPETSLARSVRLHLLSEHRMMGALQMEEIDAEARHGELHLSEQQNHPVDDLRFRPGLALNVLLLNLARCEQVQRLLIPAQSTQV